MVGFVFIFEGGEFTDDPNSHRVVVDTNMKMRVGFAGVRCSPLQRDVRIFGQSIDAMCRSDTIAEAVSSSNERLAEIRLSSRGNMVSLE
jgi:hypothetical protein